MASARRSALAAAFCGLLLDAQQVGSSEQPLGFLGERLETLLGLVPLSLLLGLHAPAQRLEFRTGLLAQLLDAGRQLLGSLKAEIRGESVFLTDHVPSHLDGICNTHNLEFLRMAPRI